MPAISKLLPFDYDATYIRKDSPASGTAMGVIYALDEDQALDKVEELYGKPTSVGKLTSVRVSARWAGEPGHTTRYIQPNARASYTYTPPPRVDVLAGLDCMIEWKDDLDFVDVSPWPCTYKAADTTENDDE